MRSLLDALREMQALLEAWPELEPLLRDHLDGAAPPRALRPAEAPPPPSDDYTARVLAARDRQLHELYLHGVAVPDWYTPPADSLPFGALRQPPERLYPGLPDGPARDARLADLRLKGWHV